MKVIPVWKRQDFIGLVANLILIIGPSILFIVYTWRDLSSLALQIGSAVWLSLFLIILLFNLFRASSMDPGVGFLIDLHSRFWKREIFYRLLLRIYLLIK